MNKKAKLPNRQTFVNPAGIGTKSEVFGIFGLDIYLLCVMHWRHRDTNYQFLNTDKMKIKIILIGLVTVFSSCTINKTITYSTKDIQSNQDQKLSKIIFDVEEFTDKRKDSSDNGIFYVNPRKCKLDGQQVCINSERHYKKEPVPRQITHMLVEHLNKKNSFKTVVMNKKDTADYYISGNLTKFYGKQGFSTAAAVGAQFGLIGALATAGAKTKGKIIFEITDLKIYDKKNQVVKDIGTFRKEYEGDFPADAYCWCIFDNVNAKLKEYFTELIGTIETELKNTQ
jgi:phenylpyruvate tautomerase PptA (4-oxalocrotonate tautomerase family)